MIYYDAKDAVKSLKSLPQRCEERGGVGEHELSLIKAIIGDEKALFDDGLEKHKGNAKQALKEVLKQEKQEKKEKKKKKDKKQKKTDEDQEHQDVAFVGTKDEK